MAVLWMGLILVVIRMLTTNQWSELWGTLSTRTGGTKSTGTTASTTAATVVIPGNVSSATISTSSSSGTTGSTGATGATGAGTTGTGTTAASRGTATGPILNAGIGAIGQGGGGSVNRNSLPIVGISGGAVAPPIGNNPTLVQIFQALRGKGLTTAQAAGVMGNILHEDPALNIEQSNPDAHGTWAWGLIQWNSGGLGQTQGMHLSQLITGNRQKDFQNQINQIAGLFRPSFGNTPADVAGNWASQIEGCQGCAPGGSQWNARIASANAVYQQAIAQGWNQKKTPTPAPGLPIPGGAVPGSKQWWSDPGVLGLPAGKQALKLRDPRQHGRAVGSVGQLPWPIAGGKKKPVKPKARPKPKARQPVSRAMLAKRGIR